MTANINFYAIIDETTKTTPEEKVVYYTNPNEVIIFGNFTPEECSVVQGIPAPEISSTTYTSIGTQTTPDLINFLVPPPLYFNPPIPCSRCGYFSHTLDKCVAKRNVHGEFIVSHSTSKKADKFKMYQTPPISPARNTQYYNAHLIQNGRCEGDKTDYTQFVFTSDEIYDWIEEQHERFVPPLPDTNYPTPTNTQVVYMPLLMKNRRTRYIPVVIPSPDQEIDYILRYNYAITDYMIGRQAAYTY